MPIFEFHGISVDFPYDMYEPQRNYIDGLLEALKSGKNALLESPTGTGKTLCLLCGALAWQRAVVGGQTPGPSNIPRDTHSTITKAQSDWAPQKPSSSSLSEVSKKFNPDARTNAWDNLTTDLLNSENKLLAIHHSPKIQHHEAALNRNMNIEASSSVGVTEVPTIFFTSRTHSQLSQIIGELSKTSYINPSAAMPSAASSPMKSQESYDFFARPHGSKTFQNTYQNQSESAISSFRLKVTVMGSRDHLCIHHDLVNLRGAALNAACRQKLRAHTCHYEGGLSKFKPDCLTTPRDIEDLRSLGRQLGFCPFYAAKDNHANCHLVLLPYDYLLSPIMRKQLKFRLRNSVVIFDEGHNVESSAEEAGSFNLRQSIIKQAIEALSEYRLTLVEGKIELNRDSKFRPNDLLQKLEVPLTKLVEFIEKVDLNPPDDNHSTSFNVFPAIQLFNILDDCGFLSTEMPTYQEMLSKCAEWSGAADSSGSLVSQVLHRRFENSDAIIATRRAQSANEILEALTVAFSPFVQTQLRWFRVHIYEEMPYKTNIKKQKRFSLGRAEVTGNDRVLSFWCFNAGPVLLDLCATERVHCVVVTSGTLSPLDSFADALGGYGELLYPVQLANKHVIAPSQISLQIISHYTDKNQPFCYVYKNRNDLAITQATGQAVSDIIRKVPGGALVFFSSYLQMETMVNVWRNSTEWTKLEMTKKIFKEPNSSTPADFEAFIEGFKTAVKGNHIRKQKEGYSGAIMFAVARGRISEGMNFADDLCRCVIVIGVPHPTLKDPKLQLKQQVLNEAFPNANKGRKWYLQQAGRAVNQAIGRVVRHAKDFGLVVLIDQRFESSQQFAQLSQWIKPAAYRHPNRTYQDIIAQIDNFFLHHVKTVEPVETTSRPSKELLELLYSKQHSQDFTLPRTPIPKCEPMRPSKITKGGVKPIRTIHKKGNKQQNDKAQPKKSTNDSKLTKGRQLLLSSFTTKSIINSLTKKPIATDSTQGSQYSLRSPTVSNTLLDEITTKSNPVEPLENGSSNDKLCRICLSTCPLSEFQRSRACSHEACRECWKQQLSRRFECPFCRRKTRKEHLTPS